MATLHVDAIAVVADVHRRAIQNCINSFLMSDGHLECSAAIPQFEGQALELAR